MGQSQTEEWPGTSKNTPCGDECHLTSMSKMSAIPRRHFHLSVRLTYTDVNQLVTAKFFEASALSRLASKSRALKKFVTRVLVFRGG